MEYLILLVFGTLCVGLMLVMYQKNSELYDAIRRNEEKIKEFERYSNPGEHDSMIRQRMSNTESRVTSLEKLLKNHNDKFELVDQKVNSALEGGASAGGSGGAVSEEQNKVLTNQIVFVNDRVNQIANQVEALSTAQTYLAGRALMLENTNVCVFSGTESCPPNLKKVGTFGVIDHSPEKIVPPGYFQGGAFNAEGWNWIHGGLCCMEAVVGN
mmetsp:Transcript_14309/g.28524  ORF Transcript_14309/g.28524 Transcript_14309/m.28524 type:complete len:213 (+) Transcript_14309:24-662(+)